MITETLPPQMDDKASRGAWKELDRTNNICPGCGREIYRHDKDICYSRTKRKTSVFWHMGCTGKVWH